MNITLTLTKEEAKKLKDYAAHENLSVSRFIAKALLLTPPEND